MLSHYYSLTGLCFFLKWVQPQHPEVLQYGGHVGL